MTGARERDLQVIPAIDLRRGEVVRLERGDDARRTTYPHEPRALLERFAAAGCSWVHVIDLDGAFGEAPQTALIGDLAAAGATLGLQVETGGGLRDEDAVATALDAGCARVILGSMVVKDPARFEAIVARFPGRVVPALEVAGGTVRIGGWTEETSLTADDLARRLRGLDCPAVLVTDVERDGLLTGANVELARRVGELSGIPTIVSGGVRSADDFAAAAQHPEIESVIVGKALYEGRVVLEEALRAAAGERPPSQAVDIPRSPEPPGASGLTFRVVPCLDVKAGRVVKGVQFRDLRDLGDPAESAARYADEGADEIVFLDIGAAPEARDTAIEWVERTAEQVFVPLTVGGGVRSVDDAARLLRSGADKVGVNTAAVEDPELLTRLAERFGAQCVVLSVDARRVPAADGAPAWEVVTHGGRKPRGMDALDWIARGVELGAGEILLTSIDADGTKDGYDLELLRAARRRVDVPIIASGGAGTIDHLADALGAGASAVLAASIFHESTFTVDEVKSRLVDRGFAMRPPFEDAS